MSLIFLPRPGARERHLKRQYKNPLFSEEQREFDEQRISGARYMNEKEEAEFTEKFHSLLGEVAELKPNEGSEKMLDLKSRLDQSYEQSSGLSGKRDNEKLAITQLVNVIMNSVWKGAEGDAEAAQNLKEEELARTTHYQLLAFPLVADLLRPRSPIAQDQLVPTLLSESESALSAAFQLFDREHQELIYQQAKQLLEDNKQDKDNLSEAWKHLEQMSQLLL
ncbi:MAG: hypothetical protein KZQ70_10240 [gamma proteobacterium symbiont of Lucinoma myriamae]|nr:hypothetical protein [gamma proteobacterium symbiont of Lucinoma myriamae]MCU7819233.1 hypothetical protein [gamma proteobacterium symbiont of Lucinoma myriamae]MCU7832719.1 hypothetical protein [gamma proteobacterium symbiont of Lucinoma myriamae]